MEIKMNKTGVPLTFHPLSKGYIWLLAFVLILAIGNSGTWVLLLILLFVAYLDSDKAITETQQVSRRIEEFYGLKPSGWGNFMLLLVINKMQQRVNLGQVWSVDGLKRVNNVYAVTEGNLLRLITPSKNEAGTEVFTEIPMRSFMSPYTGTTENHTTDPNIPEGNPLTLKKDEES
jgi:hypothetical protein